MDLFDDFLRDKPFLLKLNRHKIKIYYAKIRILNFQTEETICEFQGKVVGGNMNVAANSPVRRTGSLQILFDNTTSDITNVSNFISIDKKISLSIGIENPFYNTEEYRRYGDILWFKQGVFFITGASSSITTNSCSVSINFIDKMGKLNGVCGGIIPASTSFHEKIIFHPNGEDYDTYYTLIKDIIFEAVHHFGEEDPSRIIIEDVEETGYKVIEYLGTSPIRFKKNEDLTGKFVGYSYVISSSPVAGYDLVYTKGSPIGYLETDLTYPGELIFGAGSTITNLLDSLVQALGNYEYFYDVDGVFHFQRIKNYLMTGHTPLNYQQDDLNDINFQQLYLPVFSDYSFINEFADNELISQAQLSPKYDNIKNDFVCWGTRNSTDKTNTMVRYHLAIDERPKNISKKDDPNNFSLCHSDIYVVKNEETKEVIRYQADTTYIMPGEEVSLYSSSLDSIFGSTFPEATFNWREELYRKALLAYGTSTDGSYYDEELLAEWRNIYNPDSEEFKSRWEAQFGQTWQGYTIDVQIAPDNLRYWLDIIDSSASISKFSVKKIGRRTKVINNSNVNQVFPKDVPAIYFIENTGNMPKVNEKVQKYISEGRECALANSETLQYFGYLDSFGSCYESVREALYYNLNFNASIQLQTIPVFYLDVNRIIRVNLPDLHVIGDYIINTISWQIGNYSTMSIQANEAITIN